MQPPVPRNSTAVVPTIDQKNAQFKQFHKQEVRACSKTGSAKSGLLLKSVAYCSAGIDNKENSIQKSFSIKHFIKVN